MKIYKSQSAVDKDIKDGVLNIKESVAFECSISIEAKIVVDGDIDARDINARDIDAWDISARDINAGKNINASDIDAWNINAGDIDAGDILYYAFCCVYNSILCVSIKAKRAKHREPICLDGELKFKEEKQEAEKLTVEEVCKELGRTVEIIK